jgi:hypothetical protein
MKLIRTAESFEVSLSKSEWLEIGKHFRMAEETAIEQTEQVAEVDAQMPNVGDETEEQTIEERQIEEQSDEIRVEEGKEAMMTTDLDELNKAMLADIAKYKSFLPEDIQKIFLTTPEGRVALSEFMENFNPKTDMVKFQTLNRLLEDAKEQYREDFLTRRKENRELGLDQ